MFTTFWWGVSCAKRGLYRRGRAAKRYWAICVVGFHSRAFRFGKLRWTHLSARASRRFIKLARKIASFVKAAARPPCGEVPKGKVGTAVQAIASTAWKVIDFAQLSYSERVCLSPIGLGLENEEVCCRVADPERGRGPGQTRPRSCKTDTSACNRRSRASGPNGPLDMGLVADQPPS
jgi:hypothetical protein